MSVTIWHNPRCSKSRQTLQLLADHGHATVVVEYLRTPPSIDDLRQTLQKLDMTPRDLMRQKETAYKEQGLDDTNLDDATLVQAMHDNPILIERPVVLANGKAALGRPPEQVLDIL